jgi:3-oxoacyl-[acyl-carrier-protein] synthase-1/3-oxoacyl-[acyl-carrier-protein] synthase II
VKPVAVVAVAAESALGSDRAAHSVGAVGEVPTTAIVEDEPLRAAGLVKPRVARAKVPLDRAVEPAESLLRRVLESIARALDHELANWRERRVGVCLGTSSGAMGSLTRALSLRAAGEPLSQPLARQSPYFGPLVAVGSALGVAPSESVQVLAACASSAIAIGLGCRWLELDVADVVIAGGYDAVSSFVAAGFESIGATSDRTPAPFRTGRDGMSLGEGACVLALVRGHDANAGCRRWLRGFGASADAVHVTAPDRTGSGLARAARRALEDAGTSPADVDLVSAHATATPYNDPAEALALGAVLGARAKAPVVHPFKAVIGHTLGASSALELAAAFDAMERGVLPAALGAGPLDPGCDVRLLAENEAGSPRVALKLSAAFGGANAALVASLERGIAPSLAERTPHAVEVATIGVPALELDAEGVAPRTRLTTAQLARMDRLSALAVAAAARAFEAAPELDRERTGVVVGTACATLENNEAFDRRFRERGAKAAEPRRFPPTSPNLPAGQVSIAFSLGGPSLAVGGSLAASIEALLVAHDLIAAGDIDAVVVVAAEDVGTTARDVWAAAGWPIPAAGAVAAVLRRRDGGAALDRNHLKAAHETALAAGGRLGSAPGYPAFLAALGVEQP